MFVFSIICLLAALGCFGRWYYLRKQQKEQRGFIVIGGTLFLMWLFPGLALFILGFVILTLLA